MIRYLKASVSAEIVGENREIGKHSLTAMVFVVFQDLLAAFERLFVLLHIVVVLQPD